MIKRNFVIIQDSLKLPLHLSGLLPPAPAMIPVFVNFSQSPFPFQLFPALSPSHYDVLNHRPLSYQHP